MAGSVTDIFAGVDGTGTESDVLKADRKIAVKIGGKSTVESAGPTTAGRKDTKNPGVGKDMTFTDLGANPYYAKTFVKGNIYTFHNNWHGLRKYYQRGPEAEGVSTNNRGDRVVKWLEEAQKHNTGRIFLFGYSRGGAAVVAAAHALKKQGVGVYGLMLFDAVNRTIGHSGWTSFGSGIAEEKTIVPDNVTHCFHLRRHFQSGSRDFMGNCATELENRGKTKYTESFIWGTHSSMGGIAYKPGAEQTVNDFATETFTGKTKVRFREDTVAAQESLKTMQDYLRSIL